MSLTTTPTEFPRRLTAPRPGHYQGYIDEITDTHVTGWARDLRAPTTRVDITIALDSRIIATGRADQFYPPLQTDPFGDAHYGFKIPLAHPLTQEECRQLGAYPGPSRGPLDRAPRFQGFVDARSVHHAAGWVRDRFSPHERLTVEAVLPHPGGEVILAQRKAADFYTALATQSIGDGCYGFQLLFNRQLTEAERDTVVIRITETNEILPLAPRISETFELLSFVALDIVNNCNLRCPFCLFDYANTRATKFMSAETFESAIRLMPNVPDAGFWLSCLHEPSMHPDFLNLLDRIPRAYRRKVMFTTNLAKRMPDSYYEALAASGVFHINISIESIVPEIYERLRKGARWPIFKENWDRLIKAWQTAESPPRLRYIMMAYKSNLAEIPALVDYFRRERHAWQVEVRHTYEMPHIPESFATAEYLDDADWDWLAQQLAIYPPDDVLLIPPLPRLPASEPASTPADVPASNESPPPAPIASAVEPHIELPLNLQVEWDGKITICGKWDHPDERRMAAVTNITALPDPYHYLSTLPSMPKIQGYVDELSNTIVTGWVRDLHDPKARIAYDVALLLPEETRIIAEGVADILCPPLLDGSFGDGRYGFSATFPPITDEERDCLAVRPVHSKIPLDRAPEFQGFVDERSTRHAAGWVRNRFAPDRHASVEAVLIINKTETILATTRADLPYPELEFQTVAKVNYGFYLEFPHPLTESERDSLTIRPANSKTPLDLSPRLRTTEFSKLRLQQMA
jgi:hypothetical protein